MNTQTKQHGFTLIELLVVIAIIAILATLLVPSVGYAVKLARASKTASFVKNLDEGANLYKNDNGYYPGQDLDLPSPLTFGGSGANAITGSQALVASMFVDSTHDASALCEAIHGNTFENIIDKDGGYIIYNDDKFATIQSKNFSLVDPIFVNYSANQQMPILYFPSHYGQANEAQFFLSDNSAYSACGFNTDADTQTKFQTWLGGHNKNNVTVNDGKFLIISAGLDKEFFTDDEIKNW